MCPCKSNWNRFVHSIWLIYHVLPPSRRSSEWILDELTASGFADEEDATKCCMKATFMNGMPDNVRGRLQSSASRESLTLRELLERYLSGWLAWSDSSSHSNILSSHLSLLAHPHSQSAKTVCSFWHHNIQKSWRRLVYIIWGRVTGCFH